MKITFLLGLLLCVLVCVSGAQAQVKWSAPMGQYPSQWSTGAPPGPIYEQDRNAPAQPNSYPRPASATPYAYNYQGNYDQQPADNNRRWFPRPKPVFSGNPFLHPPMFP
jgi:hypothetical protein